MWDPNGDFGCGLQVTTMINNVECIEWPTCIMTSRTRAGVKLRWRAIENVWGFCIPPDKHRYNLWSIVAVAALFACIDHSRMFYPPNRSYALRTLRNVSASMQSYAHAQESQLQSLQLPSQLPQVRVSVRDNLLHLNRSCRRRKTRCPAHIHAHLHDLAMVQLHCTMSYFIRLKW